VRRLVKIVVDGFIAFSWSWTGFAKDKGWVNDDQRMYVLLSILALFLLREIHSLMQKPAGGDEVRERRDLIEDYLGTVLEKYYENLGLPSSADLPAIRINVALLTHLSFWRKRMRMYYSQSAADGYSDAEFLMLFREGEGTMGAAWKAKKPAYFPVSIGVQLKVDRDKVPLVANVKSALSVPLHAKNKVVGVLSLDSQFAIDVTKFARDDIVKFVETAAKKIEPFCFSTGVK
jgi:hypothetical protein